MTHRPLDCAIRMAAAAASRRRPAIAVCLSLAAFIGNQEIGADDGQEGSTESRRIAQTFDFVSDHAQAVLTERPVLVYSDPARVLSDSTCWLWCVDGVPVGALTVEFNPAADDGRGKWTFEGAALRSETWTLRHGDAEWKLTDADELPTALVSATAPADDGVVRLRQMKRLARQFEASTDSSEGLSSLRLLPSPIYRFPEDATDAIDGAVFAFTYGTNPEVLLVVEAVENDGRPEWQYRLAPLTAAEAMVKVMGKEDWIQAEYTGRGTRSNYVNGGVEVPVDLDQSRQTGGK